MFRQVYGHKTRIATDIMIERALALGIQDGALPEEAYTVPVGRQRTRDRTRGSCGRTSGRLTPL